MIPPGTAVPEVDVYDGRGGAPLPVFFEGPTLLLFFRDNCVRCEGMLGLAAGLGRIAKGLTVIGISQETIEDTAELLNRIGVKLPVVIDDRPYRASQAFEIEFVPALVMLEEDVVTWTSDGCSLDDIDAIAGNLSGWIGDRDFGLRSEYAAEPAVASKHIQRAG